MFAQISHEHFFFRFKVEAENVTVQQLLAPVLVTVDVLPLTSGQDPTVECVLQQNANGQCYSVPQTQADIGNAVSLLFSAGIGEILP